MMDSLRNLLTGSVRRRLVIGVAVVHAVLMTLFAVDLVYRQMQFLKAKSVSEASGLARQIAINSVSWLLADDVRGLSEVVRALRSHPNLVYAMVTDQQGQVLAHTDLDRLGFYVTDSRSQDLLRGPAEIRTVAQSRRRVEVAMPVLVENRLMGWVRVALDQSEEIASLQKTQWEGGFYILTAIVVGTLCAQWIAKYLTGDLQKLGETVERLASNDRQMTPLRRPAREIARLEQAFGAMSKIIWQREDELRLSISQLAATNAELERFAYLASHDLQEPLRSVVSFAQLLETRYKGRLDADADQFIAFIVEGGRRMSQQVQGLQEFFRAETHGGQLAPVRLAEAAAEALWRLQEPIRQTASQVEVGDLPVLLGDRRQWVLLLQNLMDNAIKYRAPDRQAEIRLGSQRDGDFWRVWVTDNGRGIAPENREVAFRLFMRLNNDETVPGTGVGLAVCRKIVESLDGRIWIEDNNEAPGCTVMMRFPVPRSVETTAA
ncbi:MAG: hypothetical protein HYU59_15095 [Magnetospirillum gryphiswaldense]|nr:hypothetical protein [Magnetospirillum gryphiswaldense]